MKQSLDDLIRTEKPEVVAAARRSANEIMALREKEDARKAQMERAALKAMAALIATGNYTARDRWEVAKNAKAFADAMIVTMEEEQ